MSPQAEERSACESAWQAATPPGSPKAGTGTREGQDWQDHECEQAEKTTRRREEEHQYLFGAPAASWRSLIRRFCPLPTGPPCPARAGSGTQCASRGAFCISKAHLPWHIKAHLGTSRRILAHQGAPWDPRVHPVGSRSTLAS